MPRFHTQVSSRSRTSGSSPQRLGLAGQAACAAVLLLAGWYGITSGQTSLKLGAQESPARTAAKPASDDSRAGGSHPQAAELLQQARQLIARRRSVQASVVELAAFSQPPIRMTGRYVSQGMKLRLEYEVALSRGASGKLTEVSDGERLWTFLDLPGSQRVTRRDIRQILAAADRLGAPHSVALTPDLATGGLPALLASFAESINFEEPATATDGSEPVFVLNGRWNQHFASLIPKDRKGRTGTPRLPDGVSLTLSRDLLFPTRIRYWTQQDQKRRTVLDLRFQQIVLDELIDDREFNFTPPENIEAEDVTRQYLEALNDEATAATGGAANQ